MQKDQIKNQPITHWIYAGPYELDVSELYTDNYKVPVEPYGSLLDQARRKLAADGNYPVEGCELELYGQKRQWALLRLNESEKKVTWAGFGYYARLMVTYTYNQLVVKEAGIYRFTLWAAGSIVIRMNGKEVFNHWKVGRVDGNFTFEAELKQGANHCIIMLANVHLHCTNSFSLILEDKECQVNVPLVTGDTGKRECLEKDFRKFYLRNRLFKQGEDITVFTDIPVTCQGEFIFTVTKNVYKEKTEEYGLFERKGTFDPFRAAVLSLCRADDLEFPGVYYIDIDYKDVDGTVIEGTRLTLEKVTFMEKVAEGGYQERSKFIIERYAALRAKTRYAAVFSELAKLEAGKADQLDISAIREGIDYVNTRYDCSDFALHGLLRMYYKFGDSKVLPEEIKEEMKKCILGFKYWEDEPGKNMLFTRSENHEMLYFTAEYLAGLLFPTENFTNSNQNGLFHIQKGKLNAERWIKQKGTYGFMEWHSNTYYEEDMLALLNIYDFGEESGYIRILAKNLLDLVIMLIASNSYRGVMATTHGRCYENHIMYPETEPMSHINWLLFGQPKVLTDKVSIGTVALAGSKYTPPAAGEIIANSQEEMITLTRMGLFPHMGLGGVNCATYRTKDYMVSGLVESNKGEFGHQVHAGQVLLDGNVPVFVTCFDNKSETTRPSYWGGQYRTPNTVAYKNILAYIYKIEDLVGYTHCYFPLNQFDAVVERGKWLFGYKNDAYIALYSLKPYTKVSEGSYKDRELLCLEKRNIWLIEMGNKERWGSFERFMGAVAKARLLEENEDVLYDSPTSGTIELGWDRVCTVNGVPVREKDFPLIQNPYAQGEYGSGITYLKLLGQQRILNFNI